MIAKIREACFRHWINIKKVIATSYLTIKKKEISYISDFFLKKRLI